MKRINSKTARIAAFVGALGVSAALVGTAANATGAYFTDSKTGNLAATSGHLHLNQIGDYNLNYTGLVPGEDQTKTISYSTDTNTPEDVWLYFPGGTPYGKFTGGGAGDAYSGNYADGGLGRYAHFGVSNNEGQTQFDSYNLKNNPDGSNSCVDANGHGSSPHATSATDTPPYCGVPHYMLVQTNVPDGATRHFTLTFGLTGKAQGQDATWANVPFTVVATQHGVRPDASNF